MDSICKYDSPIGELSIVSNGTEITEISFCEQRNDSPLNSWSEIQELPVFRETKEWLDCYFKGEKPDFTPPIALVGSSFRLDVWQILKGIPYGTTITYGEIAKELAQKYHIQKMSAQAIGGAVGHNPVSIIVPCHRVIGAKGRLTGYTGGLDKKIFLLKLEQVDLRWE